MERHTMKEESEDRVDLSEYLRAVSRRRLMVILPTAIVLVTAWIGLRLVTPIYQSYAVIEIIDQDVVEDMANELTDGRAGRRGDRPRDYEKERLVQLNQQVTSPPFLTPVGKRLRLDRDPKVLTTIQNMQSRLPDLKLSDLVVYAYTGRLKKRIKVERDGISRYRFICEHEDPQYAYAMARAVADEYLDYTLEQGIEVLDRTRVFSGEQLERYHKLLTQAENALEATQREHQGRALITENPVTPENFPAARGLLDEAELELRTLEQRIQNGLDRLPPGLRQSGVLESKINSSSVTSLSEVLRQAELNQVALLIQGVAAGTLVASEVSRTRQELFAEIQDRVNQAYPTQSLAVQKQIRDIVFDRNTLASVRGRRARIQEFIGRYTAGVVRQPEDDIVLRRLQEEVDRYRQLVAKIEERRTTDELRRDATEASVTSRVKVIASPEVPTKPSWPDHGRVLLLALVAGPLLGIGAVIMAESMDTSLRSVEEIETELGLPVLGTIPRLVGTNHKPRRKPRRRLGSGVAAAGAAGDGAAGRTGGMG